VTVLAGVIDIQNVTQKKFRRLRRV